MPRALIEALSSKIMGAVTLGVNGCSSVIVKQVEGFFNRQDFFNGDELAGEGAGVEPCQSASQLDFRLGSCDFRHKIL